MFELIPLSYNRSFRSPFREMDNLARAFFNEPFFSGKAEIRPFRTDIRKTEEGYLLEADLPGFDKKDIGLELKDDILTIKAQRHSNVEDKDEKENFVRIERSYGSYERSFDVSGIDTDKIKAKYENGVLSLNMPEKEVRLPEAKTLEIE